LDIISIILLYFGYNTVKLKVEKTRSSLTVFVGRGYALPFFSLPGKGIGHFGYNFNYCIIFMILYNK